VGLPTQHNKRSPGLFSWASWSQRIPFVRERASHLPTYVKARPPNSQLHIDLVRDSLPPRGKHRMIFSPRKAYLMHRRSAANDAIRHSEEIGKLEQGELKSKSCDAKSRRDKRLA